MDKFVLVLAAALCFSTSAIAEVTCHTDAFGDVNCTGYDKDGHYVNTTSHKDAFGDVTTTGHIGNRRDPERGGREEPHSVFDADFNQNGCLRKESPRAEISRGAPSPYPITGKKKETKVFGNRPPGLAGGGSAWERVEGFPIPFP